MISQTHQKGFNLIEIIIVIAIISILAGIAYPTYTQNMLETRRTDGWIALSAAAAAQQRWHAINFTYTEDMSDLGGTLSAEEYYTMSVVADVSTFTLTATANSSDVQAADTGCTVLTLTETGSQSPASCW